MLALPDPDHRALSACRVLHAGRGLFLQSTTCPTIGCATDETYPFTLLTGRVSHHHHTGTMTRRSWALWIISGAFLDACTRTMRRPCGSGQLESARDVAAKGFPSLARLRTTMDLQPRPFSPRHFAESPANALTSRNISTPIKIALKLTPVRVEEAEIRERIREYRGRESFLESFLSPSPSRLS